MTWESSIDRAAGLAEKIRAETEKLDKEQLRGVTVSLGVTQYLEGEPKATFLKRVDVALYQSKTHGQNRVTVVR